MSQQKSYKVFSGIQTSTNPYIAEEGELADLKNGNTEVIGAARRRDGYSRKGNQITASEDVLGLYQYRRNANSTNYLLATLDSDIYQFNSGTSDYDAQSQSLTADKKMEFETYLDRCYAVNGDDETRSYDGTSWYTSDSWDASGGVFNAPKAKYIREFNNVLYLGNCNDGSDDYPSRIYYCAVATGPLAYVDGDVDDTVTELTLTSVRYLRAGMVIDIYTAGTDTKVEDITIAGVNRADKTITFSSQAIDVSDSDEIYIDGKKGDPVVVWDDDPDEGDYADFKFDSGGEITGMGVNNNRLLVFKKNSLHNFDGATPGTISEVVGTPSGRTVKNVRSKTVFLHRTGVYVYAEGQVTPISNPIYKEFIKNMPADLSDTFAFVEDDRFYHVYVGAITGTNYSNAVLCYDFDTNSWFIYEYDDTFKVAAVLETSTENYVILGNDDGEIMQLDGSTDDNGVSIPFRMETLYLDQGFPERRKTYTYIYVFTDKGQGATLKAKVDDKDWETVGELHGEYTKLNTNLEGKKIKFAIVHNQPKASPQINQIKLLYELSGRE